MCLYIIISLFTGKSQQHVPVHEYSENLKEMTRFLASAGVTADRVIFITPPPLHEPSWEKECILKGNRSFSPSSFLSFYKPSPTQILSIPLCFLQDVLSIATTL